LFTQSKQFDRTRLIVKYLLERAN